MAFGLILFSCSSLLSFKSIFLWGSQIFLPVFKSSLIRSESCISRSCIKNLLMYMIYLQWKWGEIIVLLILFISILVNLKYLYLIFGFLFYQSNRFIPITIYFIHLFSNGIFNPSFNLVLTFAIPTFLLEYYLTSIACTPIMEIHFPWMIYIHFPHNYIMNSAHTLIILNFIVILLQ